MQQVREALEELWRAVKPPLMNSSPSLLRQASLIMNALARIRNALQERGPAWCNFLMQAGLWQFAFRDPEELCYHNEQGRRAP